MLDLEAIRAEFPVTRAWVYLNHAGIAPISRRVHRAMRVLLKDVEENGMVNHAAWTETVRRTRISAARMLNAHPAEIAFVKNTTEGILIVANGIRWRNGDNVVLAEKEFPANVYPWLNLERKGVEVRFAREAEGCIPVEEVARQVDGRTRVVSLSSVEFATGYRNDLDALGELCRQRGVLFCVDAIQSLGALPIDVRRSRIDFLSADGHKWLLGPEGTGVFYCGRAAMGKLEVANLGWGGVVDPNDYLNYDATPAPTAERFEPGTLNTAGIYGLRAALDLLLSVGLDRIEARVLALTDLLCEALRRRGYRVHSPRGKSEKSGIVTFSHDRHPAGELLRRLREERVVGAVRDGKVRFSPHFYNTDEEIDRAVRALPD
jgi:selenocysteine lyase/cysteine desulfurase